jgi:hypothetical protein
MNYPCTVYTKIYTCSGYRYPCDQFTLQVVKCILSSITYTFYFIFAKSFNRLISVIKIFRNNEIHADFLEFRNFK